MNTLQDLTLQFVLRTSSIGISRSKWLGVLKTLCINIDSVVKVNNWMVLCDDKTSSPGADFPSGGRNLILSTNESKAIPIIRLDLSRHYWSNKLTKLEKKYKIVPFGIAFLSSSESVFMQAFNSACNWTGRTHS